MTPVEELWIAQVEIPEWRLRLERGTDRETSSRQVPSDPQPDRDLRLSLQRFGQLQPIGVRATARTHPKWGAVYEIVFGRRRLEQAKRNGETKIAASVLPLDDDAALMIAIQENHARRDINGAELGRALSRLKTQGEYTIRELAKVTGLSRDLVQQLVRIDRYICDELRAVWERYGDRLPAGARLRELARIAAMPQAAQLAEWERVNKLRARRGNGGRPKISQFERAEKKIAHLAFTDEEKKLLILGAKLALELVRADELGFEVPDIAERRRLAFAARERVSSAGEQHRRKVPPSE